MRHIASAPLFQSSLFAAAVVCLGLSFTEVLCQAFEGNFSNDALMHHGKIVGASTLWDLRLRLQDELQPMLDYGLRKLFWYPLLGTDERAIRAPDLVAALILVVASPCWLYVWFRRQGASWLASVSLALGYGFWLAGQPNVRYVLNDSRHYELTALMSFVWFSAHFLRARRDVLYGMAAVGFANVHFFSLPLISTAMLWEAWTLAREGRLAQARHTIAALAVGLVGTLALNWPALHFLLTRSWQWSGPLEASVLAAFRLYTHWYGAFALPLGLLFPAAALASALWDRRRLGFFAILCLAFPLFAFVVRTRTQHGFVNGAVRYYFPFFGLTTVLFAWGGDAIRRGLAKLGRAGATGLRIDVEKMRRLQPILALLFLASPPTTRFLRTVWQERHRFQIPPANFSPNHRDYARLDAVSAPFVLLLDAHGPDHAIAFHYLRRAKREASRLLGTWSPFKQTREPGQRETIQRLLSSRGPVVFEFREPQRPCPSDLSVRLAGLATHNFGARRKCLFSVLGVGTLEEARRVAVRAGFRLEGI